MALAKDRIPHDSQMSLSFYGNAPSVPFSHLSSPGNSEETGDNSKNTTGVHTNFVAMSRSSSLPASYQSEETHSVISFKSGYENFLHTSGSLLSFDQNEGSILRENHLNHHPRVVSNTRLMENLSCTHIATTNYGCMMSNTVKDDYHFEEPFGWSNTEAIDEIGTEESSFLKRPHMGESMQAFKKQCTSETKKPKPKSTQSKDPQSIAAKNRRERISERLKILQDLVPNGSKVDLVTMLEKAISYVKFLQLQVKVLATDELWPVQGGKAPELSQVKDAIDAILASQKDRNSSSSSK